MNFGVYSLLLLIAALNGLVLAGLLLLPIGRHLGSGWLSALTACIALRLTPYILGFAGAYDTYHWLTFAPFDLTLLWGPLLWAYVTTLTTGRPPAHLQRHLLPGLLQLGYQLVCFALPTSAKWAWYTGVHLELVEPVGAVVVLLSLGAYGVASLRAYERWQRWLDDNVSNRDESRHRWLQVLLGGIAVTAAATAALLAIHWLVTPVSYFARLPLIVMLGVLTYVIGLLGIRYGRDAIQQTDAPSTALVQAQSEAALRPAPELVPAPGSNAKGYRQSALEWRERVLASGWHRDSQLTLETLARALHTSPRTLSRTLNDGLGVSFNAFVNELRVNEAQQLLTASESRSALEIAFAVGFASKASFNRAFQRHAGVTPTEYRSRAMQPSLVQQ